MAENRDKIRDAYVKVLLRIEEDKGERIINAARFLLSLLYTVLAFGLKSEMPLPSFIMILGAGIVSLLFAGYTHYAIYYGTIRPWLKTFASVFDIVIVSAALFQFGGYRTFKNEAFFLYFIWIALVNLRFSALLTILASATTFVLYVALAVTAFIRGTIQIGTIAESYVTEVVSIENIILKSIFLGSFCVVSVYIARVHRRLINKSVETELEAARQFEDRIRAQTKSLQATEAMLKSFSRFVPARLLEYLKAEDITHINLGDAVEKDLSILFVDIRNFTGMSEKMTVSENFRFMNAYLKRMSPVIEAHGGIVDKFIGDEIMSLFPDSAENALKAAIEMRHELSIYNTDRRKIGYVPIDIGAGLHTGNVMLGTVGSENRINTTIIGDNVNLAARLQTLTKSFGTKIILSDFVYRKLPDTSLFCLREIDSVLVKGKEKPVVLYECFDADPAELREVKQELYGDLQLALFQYKAGNFGECKAILTEYTRKCPNDTIPAIYLKRLEILTNRKIGPNWTGVSRMK
ncbi:MAG: adenylate/guanylate cyclase domain-containing protein [Spirochaetia bacterium]|nr:adenylate/guanylate cyclase domain-containing protein [Spirochaetia bacterium]